MKKALSILACSLLFWGCARGGNIESAPASYVTSKTFSAPKDVVWAAIVSEIGMEYPVRAIEKESGLISTEFVSVDAGYNNSQITKWATPPRIFLSTWNGFRVALSVMTTEPAQGQTHVVVKADCEAYENNVSKSWVQCQSRGKIESDLLARISVRVPPTP